jgi:hypothetical protein
MQATVSILSRSASLDNTYGALAILCDVCLAARVDHDGDGVKVSTPATAINHTACHCPYEKVLLEPVQ